MPRYPLFVPTGHGDHVECHDKAQLCEAFLAFAGAKPPCKLVVIYDGWETEVEGMIFRALDRDRTGISPAVQH
jgi:hypothetical protein